MLPLHPSIHPPGAPPPPWRGGSRRGDGHVMSWSARAIVRWSAQWASIGRTSSRHTHTRTPMEWATGEGGPRALSSPPPPPPPPPGMAANTSVLTDVTSQSIQQDATAHTKGCRHHTSCRNRPNTQQITKAAKQPNLPSNQHTIQPTPPTTPHENTAHHRARHVTTTHYRPTQYNIPRHCTVQHTIADHTQQQTTTQHTTPLYTLRDHSHVMWCGRVSRGVVWCHVVWCGVVGYRAIGLPV